MDRQRVNSTNLRSIGYDASLSILEVEFTTGAIYQYLNVPEAIFDAFVSASSKGSYLNNNIKDRYPAHKIR